MPTDTTIVKPTAPLFDEARLAIAGGGPLSSSSCAHRYAQELVDS